MDKVPTVKIELVILSLYPRIQAILTLPVPIPDEEKKLT